VARILVIDDTKNIRRMVRSVLRGSGHAVEDAEDGETGLEKFGSGEHFDLTLIDHRMPGIQGREVLLEMRRRDPNSRLIMVTAFATMSLAADIIQAGATDFLRKPFSTDMLRGAVEKALLRAPRGEAELPPLSQHFHADQLPQISYTINGFDFWPALPEATEVWPIGVEVGRVFVVRNGSGAATRCLVGITPHLREHIRHETRCDFAENANFWDTVSQLALSEFLWRSPELPPPVLPVFELSGMMVVAVRDMAGQKPYIDY